MRGLLFLCAALALAVAAPAQAQTSIILNADPIPIVDARINDRPVRLEVDLRLPDVIVLNSAAAQRLGVRTIPFVAVAVGADGGTRIRGRAARPRLVFPGGASRAFGGIFPIPVSRIADGVIGPGALPYDVVTVQLKPNTEGRELVLSLDNPDSWTVDADFGGLQSGLTFDLTHNEAIFNSTAARHFDANGSIVAAGDLIEIPLILGLTTRVQPVTTGLAALNLPLSPAFARTNAPLLGADDPDAIIVEADPTRPVPPRIQLGRAALQSCDWIRVDRRAKRMTLHCAI